MKTLMGGKSVISPTLGKPRFGETGRWYDHGHLVSVGVVFFPDGSYGLEFVFALKNLSRWIYTYGYWDDTTLPLVNDAFGYVAPWAGLEGGETYNFQIRPNLLSVVPF